MNCKVISGTEPRFQFCPNPSQSTRNSILEASSHISFNAQFTKPSFSIKTSSGSHRIRAMAAINNLYATTEKRESFYELLGIPESGTLPEIKRAYKQLARKYHPDVSPPERTEEYTRTFIRVQEAYETLSDPQSRALYDRDLSKGLHLAFSARKRVQSEQRWDKRGVDWRNRWQSQLMDLKQRSMNKNSRGNMSWGARIRKERNEAFVLEFD